MLIAILCVLAADPIGRAKQAPAANQRPSNEDAPLTVTLIRSQAPETHSDAPMDKPPRWYSSPEWWLVIAAGLTLLVILVQVRDTKRSANAAQASAELARANTEILINSERAWVHAELTRSNVVNNLWILSLTNYGKTPAEIVSRKIDSYCLASDDLSDGGWFKSNTATLYKLLVVDSPDTSYNFDVEKEHWTKEWMQANKKNSGSLVMDFLIVYRDILDRQRDRRTRVVYRYDAMLRSFDLLPNYTEHS